MKTRMNITTLSSTLIPVSEKPDLNKIQIVDVWAHNLEYEMNRIVKLVERYPCVAMDTEFPGVVARPTGNFRTISEYHYQTLKCNVNMLKIIQLGLCFTDEEGNLPPDGQCTWQFNFQFNLKKDMYAQDSIALLSESGIDFERHEQVGVDVHLFGELLMSSGIVLSDDVKWISFHSAYDFGYLMKLLTNASLPDEEADFFDLLHTYFPCIYDIKYLMKSCDALKGGLAQIAVDLQVQRIGPAHQAGSDSLLTSACFWAIMELYFDKSIFSDSKYIGVLYGLGQGYDNTQMVMNNGPSTPTSTTSVNNTPTATATTTTTTGTTSGNGLSHHGMMFANGGGPSTPTTANNHNYMMEYNPEANGLLIMNAASSANSGNNSNSSNGGSMFTASPNSKWRPSTPVNNTNGGLIVGHNSSGSTASPNSSNGMYIRSHNNGPTTYL